MPSFPHLPSLLGEVGGEGGRGRLLEGGKGFQVELHKRLPHPQFAESPSPGQSGDPRQASSTGFQKPEVWSFFAETWGPASLGNRGNVRAGFSLSPGVKGRMGGWGRSGLLVLTQSPRPTTSFLFVDGRVGAGGGHTPMECPPPPGIRLPPHPTCALVGGVPVGSHKGMEFGQNNLFSLFWMPAWRRGRRSNYIGEMISLANLVCGCDEKIILRKDC